MTTVAIVEDDAGIRRGLEWLLKSSAEFSCVASCENASEALRLLPKAAPQVILMDINLPDRSGIECTAEMKQLLPSAQIVMITVYDDDEKVFSALRAGASGYVLKRTQPKKILQAIREVKAGGVPMSSEIARKVLGVFREPVSSVPGSGSGVQPSGYTEPATPTSELDLSPREQEVLELLARGCANKEIADKLSLSIETVTWHLKHIYSKLHVRSRTQAALKFLGRQKRS